jgi:phosphate transport system substrate-binding protein
MIIPTASDDQKMTTAKRQTIADFLYYSICDGQKEMGPIGYSPLPVNLVQAGFSQIAKLKAADAGVDLTQRAVSTCNNPTFVAGQPTRNYLAEIAPKPPACDRQGAGPCTGNGDTGTTNPVRSNSSNGGSTHTTASPTATTTAAPSTSAAPSAQSSVDPLTGQTTTGTGSSQQAGDVVVVPVDLAAARDETYAGVLAPLAGLLVLLALVIPPLLGRRLTRRPPEDTP